MSYKKSPHTADKKPSRRQQKTSWSSGSGVVWPYKTAGIPDELFERIESIPITKEEIRAIQISKARLSSGATVYDVGCGSGSISVEACLQVGKKGRIYAIDMNKEAVSLTRKNVSKFKVENNVTIIKGNAVDNIKKLPAGADAIFVGGTGGDTKKIVELCKDKLNSGGRIVIGIIMVETLFEVLSYLENSQKKLQKRRNATQADASSHADVFKEIDITEVTISKSRKVSTGTMMLARNPITVVSATKQ